MSEFSEQCIVLRKQGRTLTEIVKITGRPKTSVYDCIRAFPLSVRRRQTIRASQAAHLLKYALARKGKSARPFRKTVKWDGHAIFLISHFLFDGDIQHSGCSYNNRNKALLDHVESTMRTIYDFEPYRYRNPITGVLRISYFNVALRAHIEERAREILNEIHDQPLHLKRVFLQSFFDDEGCIDFRPYRNNRKIRGYQKNVDVLRIVQKLLRDFQIDSRIELPNEIVIVGKDNFLRFEKEIGFSPGVRINGKRSNSIWKKSLEKREILRRAIESYKPVGSNGVHRSSSVH